MVPVVTLAALTFLLSGCVGFYSGPNAGYYGGGSVGLFVIIIVAAIIFGRRRP